MKKHILAALREKFEEWESLLAALSEEQISTPRFDLDWSIKDVMAHLWAWQQISLARIEAGLHDRKPAFPAFVASVEDWEEEADQANAATFERNQDQPWSEVYKLWRNGFLQLLGTAEKISERDLLDGGRYPWLNGYSLAFILVASYDHHQEHLEKLSEALRQTNS